MDNTTKEARELHDILYSLIGQYNNDRRTAAQAHLAEWGNAPRSARCQLSTAVVSHEA